MYTLHKNGFGVMLKDKSYDRVRREFDRFSKPYLSDPNKAGHNPFWIESTEAK